jgi:hypothetical protein
MISRSRIIAVAVVCAMALCPAFADTTVATPFRGVRYIHRVETAPQHMVLHLVEIDLSDPDIRFTTTGDNGDAPRDTNTETTRAFVARTKAQIGINASFFVLDHKRDTTLLGLAVSEGRVVSKWAKGGFTHGINIARDNVVTFFERADPDPTGYGANPPLELYNAVTGDRRLLRNGEIVVESEGPRHPRTAVGLTRENKLLLLVVDGRQPSYSIGMTCYELAAALREFGAADALNLDGGGSTTLVFADPRPRVVNVPTTFEMPEGLVQHPPGVERRVGNNLAVFAPAAVIPAKAGIQVVQ